MPRFEIEKRTGLPETVEADRYQVEDGYLMFKIGAQSVMTIIPGRWDGVRMFPEVDEEPARDPMDTIRRANDLAREFYRHHGFTGPKDYRFDKAKHTRENHMWELAAAAFEFFEDTDISEVREELEES
jgi:hypothetical protein